MKTEVGVMLMKDGKAWGIIYQDGHSTCYGWMAPEEAPIHNPKYCKKPTDVTYSEDYNIPEIKKGRLVSVVRETVVRVME